MSARRWPRNGVVFSKASAMRRGRLPERLADELDRDRQSAVTKACAHRDRRVASDVERHRKIGPVEEVPFRQLVDLRRFRRLGRGQHDVEPGHRVLQFARNSRQRRTAWT
jgi:hypothetical protein